MLKHILEELAEIESICWNKDAIAHAQAEIMKCVPEERIVDKDLAGWSHKGGVDEGWNACREEMINHLSKQDKA
jgi:hypothetical protein